MANLLLSNPVPNGWKSSGYGPRKPIQIAPGVTTLPRHYGVDYAGPIGTPIYSMSPGVVTRVGFDNDSNYEKQGIPRWPGLKRGLLYGGGWWIFVQYYGLTFRYMHFNARPKFKVGDKIAAGQYLGPMGKTGVATGSHVHIETLVNNVWVDPEGPIPDPNPEPEPLLPPPPLPPSEEEDEMKPTVHVRQDSKGAFSEATRAHPEIGKELAPGVSRKSGNVTVYRGWEATSNRDIAIAWARTHAAGFSPTGVTSWSDRAGYIVIQEQATRLSIEFFGEAGK